MDLRENNGTATFVPFDLQYAGRNNFEIYGKILTKQQRIIQTNSHQTLIRISQSDMELIKDKLLEVPDLNKVNYTRRTYTQGQWYVVTTSSISQLNLKQIDLIIDQVPKQSNTNFRGPARRIITSNKKVQEALQKSWTIQTLGVTRQQESPLNAWRTTPKFMRQKTQPKGIKPIPDNTSVGTTTTVSNNLLNQYNSNSKP